MDAPFFSIVTVTLNSGERLRATGDSLARQTYGDWEHIIKDGGSSDGSCAAVPADARRRVVVRQDRGIFDAMNQALALCRGRYVLFLNAGDEFTATDVLSRVAGVAQESDTPFIYTDIFYRSAGVVRPYPNQLTRAYLYRQIPCQQALYVERSVYSTFGGFDLAYSCLADPELVLRLVLQKQVKAVRCPVPGVVYEGGGFSSTESFRRRAAVERRRLRDRYFTKKEQLAWGTRRYLLLQPLREWINHRYPNGPVARLNHWATSLLNRHG